ncbi:replication stress response regulator SDE2-like [Camellia sinensis]|uniref:replication stress response regulator SDE2-like n=1 Tax=Camellia sinensis TaxID=4442 RepID=UPI001035F748|nr:replication stress response regulator SDE2-like [Camellia sinensis]
MSLIKKLDLLADSPFRNADAIPLHFPPPPPPPPSQPEDASESEDEDGDEDDDAVAKEATPEQGLSDVPQVNKSIDETLAEIDAEVAVDKEAEVSLQETSEVQIQPDADVLGMERLKSELQSRGLKCGGTLQERAARLFLLKTTPLEKLPKKLLAKK